MTVGILAIQGDFAAHQRAFAQLGAATALVRKAADLTALGALVLPGGESTAMLHGIMRDGLDAPLAAFLKSGRPLLGTCAGAILLARRVDSPSQRSYGILGIAVTRNAYGTQLESFEAPLEGMAAFGGVSAIFIRAPRITDVDPSVTVLARVNSDPVLVRSGSTWAATFHPELGTDERVLRAWLRSSRQ